MIYEIRAPPPTLPAIRVSAIAEKDGGNAKTKIASLAGNPARGFREMNFPKKNTFFISATDALASVATEW